MASFITLTAQQIIDLKGAVDETVGTGDGSNANFSLALAPMLEKTLDLRIGTITGTRLSPNVVVDEFIGTGDGINPNFQLDFFPIDTGSLELRVQTIFGDVLTLTTDYTINETTGDIVLTASGIAALGTEQLHGKYTPTTKEYSISGPSGLIILTSAGITALGTSDLHAAYTTETSSLGRLEQEVDSIGRSIPVINDEISSLSGVDDTNKEIHIAIGDEDTAQGFLLDWQSEYANLLGFAVTAPVSEADIQNSVINYALPFYDATSPPPDPSQPFPPTAPFTTAQLVQLFGGPAPSATATYERNRLSNGTASTIANDPGRDETEAITALLAIGGPLIDRFNNFQFTNLLTSVTENETALIAEKSALDAVIAAGTNEIIDSTDISDATAARDTTDDGVTDFLAATTAYKIVLQGAPGDLSGLTNTALNDRLANAASNVTDRITFIDGTRNPSLTATLNKIWDARYTWLTRRVSLRNGSFTQLNSANDSLTVITARLPEAREEIADIELILSNQ